MTDCMMRLQLPTDRWILEELMEGRNLGANISDDIDRHQKTVTRRLNEMEDHDLVRNIGNGVYEITSKGVATLRIIDQYDRGEEFEQLIDERAQFIEVGPPEIVDRAEESE